jgi:hypothetical protein
LLDPIQPAESVIWITAALPQAPGDCATSTPQLENAKPKPRAQLCLSRRVVYLSIGHDVGLVCFRGGGVDRKLNHEVNQAVALIWWQSVPVDKSAKALGALGQRGQRLPSRHNVVMQFGV